MNSFKASCKSLILAGAAVPGPLPWQHLGSCLNSLKGGLCWTIRGVSKGDTRSFDSPWDLAWTLDP